MRHPEPGQSAKVGSREIDHIAAWLDQRTGPEAWVLVVVSAAIVAILDFSTHAFELCIATLYIVPICLASWMFRTRTAIAVTAAVTVIALLKYPLLNNDPGVLTTIYNGTSRALAFMLLNAIMLAFRRSHDHARMAATHDLLTGALNKQAFHEHALEILDMAYDGARTVLLLYLDLDGFKAMNDLHGHHVGDGILRDFAAGASQALRRGECFGRLGGDEFGAALVVDSNDEGQALAHRLHKRFSAALAASGHPVTCSMGALIVPVGSRFACADLMKEADRLMYASKNRGRNAVTVATAVSAGAIRHLPATEAPIAPHLPLRIEA